MYEGLKEYLEEKGYSQPKMAKMLGVSVPYVNAILVGPKTLGKKGAKKWANLFGLSENFLLTGKGPISPDDDAQSDEEYNEHIDALLEEKDDRIDSLEKELSFKEGQIDSLNRELCAVRGESLAKDMTIQTQKDSIDVLKRHIAILEQQLQVLRNVDDLRRNPFPVGVAEVSDNKESNRV